MGQNRKDSWRAILLYVSGGDGGRAVLRLGCVCAGVIASFAPAAPAALCAIAPAAPCAIAPAAPCAIAPAAPCATAPCAFEFAPWRLAARAAHCANHLVRRQLRHGGILPMVNHAQNQPSKWTRFTLIKNYCANTHRDGTKLRPSVGGVSFSTRCTRTLATLWSREQATSLSGRCAVPWIKCMGRVQHLPDHIPFESGGSRRLTYDIMDVQIHENPVL